MTDWLRELRYAARRLRQQPGVALAIIVTLALAIGANTAIYTVVHGLLFRPLPFPDGDRLVMIASEAGGEQGRLTLREVRDLQRDATMFEDVGAFYLSQYNVTGGGAPENVPCTINTASLFRLLGVRMLYGDAWPDAFDWTRQYTVILSHGFWQRQFGSDPSVVGQMITLDARPYRVAAVLPPEFTFPGDVGLYRAVTDYTVSDLRRFGAIARLRPGVTLAAARVEMDRFTSHFASVYPDTNRGVSLTVAPLREMYVAKARTSLWLLLGAAVALLAIACVNIVNLLLARATTATRDVAVRMALGASVSHVVRQLLFESALLAAIGGTAGVLLAVWLVHACRQWIHLDLPAWMTLPIDLHVLGVAFLATVFCGLIAGVAPALATLRRDLSGTLKSSGRGADANARHHRLRELLVIAEVTLAMILLVGAALLTRTWWQLGQVDTGFDPRRLLTLRVDPPNRYFDTIETSAQFYTQALDQIRLLPEVEAAATNDNLPQTGRTPLSFAAAIEGQTAEQQAKNPFVDLQGISPEYLDTMRIPLLRGRAFTLHDTLTAPRVAMVSARTARRFWGAEAEAIGRRLQVGKVNTASEWMTVVGVVADVRHEGLASEPGFDVYVPHHQVFAGETYFVVRTRANPLASAENVTRAIRRVYADQSVFDIQTMEARMGDTVWQQRLAGSLFGAFAGLAAVLAAVGLFGVPAFAVAQRTREIGVRLALGASPRDVFLLVSRRGLSLVVVGLVIGAGGAMGVARFLQNLLYETSPVDVVSFAMAAGVLGMAGVLASFIPARRATRVDPVVSLRQE
jgi:putative ABC transport system permease protein